MSGLRPSDSRNDGIGITQNPKFVPQKKGRSEKSDSLLIEYILVISHLIKELIASKFINWNVALAHSKLIQPESPGFSRIGGLVLV